MRYLTAAETLFIHSAVIDETGGEHGLRDLGLLESALARPQQSFDQHDLYPTLEQKAAALVASLIKNHPFVDGNKRTAVTGLGVFLELNGFLLDVSQESLVTFAEQVATDKMDLPQIAQWIKENTKKLRKRVMDSH